MEEKEKAFLDAIDELSKTEDLTEVGRELNELKVQFEDFMLEEERKDQVAQLEKQTDDKPVELQENPALVSLKETFFQAYKSLNEKKRAAIDAKKQVEAENLKKKRALIQQFKDLVANEENIGAAIAEHKKINEKWKSIGDIPRDKRHETQQTYSRLLEEFFYNMKIYREIKAYDFQKNKTLKKEVILELKALEKEEQVKEIEQQLKLLQNKWEDIGPTLQEEWEKLKEEYWAVVKQLYERIRNHYAEKKEQMKENIALKKKLIERVNDLLHLERPTVKAWNKHTKKVIQLQEEWKKIGFGPRKENEAVWKEFRALCDQFFENKSAFFKSAQEDFGKIAKEKEQLIEQAEALKDDQNWSETTPKIIKLQKSWKKVGNAGPKLEQKLWKKFRAACDHFFDAKDAFYKQLDKEKEENFKKKESLINKLQSFKLPDDTKKTIEALKSFATDFSAIGDVPRKEKDNIYRAYKDALNKHYDNLSLDKSEKEEVLFEAKLDALKGGDDASKMLNRERQNIRKEIEKIKSNILQLENNLGFFSSTSDDNPMKKQALQNVATEKEKIELLKKKLKAIPNE